MAPQIKGFAMSEETTSPSRPEEDILLDLNFVPQWAKKAPAANHYASDDRSERRPSSRDRRDGPRRERSDRRDGQARTSRSPRERSSDDRRPPSAGGTRPAFRAPQEPRRDFAPRPERIELPVEIKFLTIGSAKVIIESPLKSRVATSRLSSEFLA